MAHTGADLYEQHAQTVYRYLFSLCGDADLAEEMTQETFCRALKGLHRYRGESSPQTWLCGIAKRVWYRELEHRHRNPAAEEDRLLHMPAADDPQAETEQRMEKLSMYRAMQQLDSATREVLLLRLAGDLSFREIGEILEQSEVWARVRFYRGKQMLVTMMGGDNDDKA